MRTSKPKVSSKPTSVQLSKKDRADLERYSKLKYNGLVGITTILREEAMSHIREELARLEKVPTK